VVRNKLPSVHVECVEYLSIESTVLLRLPSGVDGALWYVYSDVC